ncbi:hypothetical protein Golax_016152 [Gossypium laxum]|uniref:Uncharacterized protein n=1 Tax=Gossypium laxum TaxID=34288 RepID=A0A7J8YWB3_9ROSI|nr:hypothetical protein [Gossypium laxum]
MCSRKYINLGIETSYPIPSNLEGMKQHNCMNLKWKKKKKYSNHCACGYVNWHTKNHSHGLANVVSKGNIGHYFVLEARQSHTARERFPTFSKRNMGHYFVLEARQSHTARERESEREKPIIEHTHGDDRKCRVKI